MESAYIDPQFGTSQNPWAVLNFPAAEELQDAIHSDLPSVPALPTTVVHLEIQLQEHAIDLRTVSGLILSDLGATVQVLRKVGDLFGPAPGRPLHMEDCIVCLGKESLLRAIPAMTFARDGRHALIAASWEYARLVGEAARKIAGALPGVDPEKAYLAGLFHDLGTIPMLLGWSSTGMDVMEFREVAQWLAREWSLPWFISAGFSDNPKSATAALWSRIVAAARELTHLAGNQVSAEPALQAAKCETVLGRHFPNMPLPAQHTLAQVFAMPMAV